MGAPIPSRTAPSQRRRLIPSPNRPNPYRLATPRHRATPRPCPTSLAHPDRRTPRHPIRLPAPRHANTEPSPTRLTRPSPRCPPSPRQPSPGRTTRTKPAPTLLGSPSLRTPEQTAPTCHSGPALPVSTRLANPPPRSSAQVASDSPSLVAAHPTLSPPPRLDSPRPPLTDPDQPRSPRQVRPRQPSADRSDHPRRVHPGRRCPTFQTSPSQVSSPPTRLDAPLLATTALTDFPVLTSADLVYPTSQPVPGQPSTSSRRPPEPSPHRARPRTPHRADFSSQP